jgi:hypothetical protein
LLSRFVRTLSANRRDAGKFATIARFGGDPIATSYSDRLNKGDWQALENFLLGLPDSELRDFYVGALADEVVGHPRWIDEWVARRPGQYLPLLFRGYHFIRWAWNARGQQRARDVQANAWPLFQGRLEMARVDLEAAAGVAPAGEAGAWVYMIPMARGLGFDRATVWSIYAEAQRRRPWHQIAHTQMIQNLAPKWRGSLAMMFDFARSTAEAPAGSGAPIAMAHAHYEASAEEGGTLHWRRPEVAQDVIWSAEQSVWAPSAVETPLSLGPHNVLFYCFGSLKDRERAARELAVIAGRITWPFTLFPDPQATYVALSSRATGTSG